MFILSCTRTNITALRASLSSCPLEDMKMPTISRRGANITVPGFHWHLLSLARWRIFRCPPRAAEEQVSLSYGHLFAPNQWRVRRSPLRAENEQVPLSHENPCSFNHLKATSWPYLARKLETFLSIACEYPRR